MVREKHLAVREFQRLAVEETNIDILRSFVDIDILIKFWNGDRKIMLVDFPPEQRNKISPTSSDEHLPK